MTRDDPHDEDDHNDDALTLRRSEDDDDDLSRVKMMIVTYRISAVPVFIQVAGRVKA